MHRSIYTSLLSVLLSVTIFSAPTFHAYSASKSKSTVILNRDEMTNISPESLPKNGTVKWDSYRKSKKDVHNGKIPVSLLTDPVYCSMNMPSESLSDEMIRASRDNGHIVTKKIPASASKLLNFGAVEETTKQTLPDSFSVYFGKMKMFAYSKSKKRWITIDSQPYPKGIYIYTLPWKTAKARKCKNVTYYNNYAKVDLTKDDLHGNCLHFWGGAAKLKKNDYLYYAASYEVWVSPNVVGKLTASGGIDSKDSACIKTLSQLYSSRGYKCTTSAKSVWGNTIPNKKYKKCKASKLNKLYYSDTRKK
ncbi:MULTISPECIES: hypothetical protein [unclassified Butyrivibrio]|uniref:hypothetical protein n=1 Tax=unclassified Butyrivibrio TaxID=2639466 RepID=UPI0004193666|nr:MULTISPECIES: hypothetical protein [unclassified Butyrivibrio]SDB68416.1 hypothetical protein SAMN02910263_04179 [Butyrivibrio sp. INlla16]